MTKQGEYDYVVIEKTDYNENENDNYDIVESKDLMENSEFFVIVDSKEKEKENINEDGQEKQKKDLENIVNINENNSVKTEQNIPNQLSHSWRFEPRIPIIHENTAWMSVPKTMLTEDFKKLCTHPKYPQAKAPKNGYVNVPEEWIYYKGNPAFVTDDLLRIFSNKKK